MTASVRLGPGAIGHSDLTFAEVGAWAPGKLGNPKCIPPFWSP